MHYIPLSCTSSPCNHVFSTWASTALYKLLQGGGGAGQLPMFVVMMSLPWLLLSGLFVGTGADNWVTAYHMPATGASGYDTVVVLTLDSFPSTPETCILGPHKSIAVSFRNEFFDRRFKKVQVLHCHFKHGVLTRQLIRETPIVIDRINWQTSVWSPSRERRDRLTICVHTFHTLDFAILSLHLTKFLKYYEAWHHLTKAVVYTDDYHLGVELETFVASWNSAQYSSKIRHVAVPPNLSSAFYHWQHFTMLDCTYRSFSESPEWIAHLDIDEFLTWPFGTRTWTDMFPHALGLEFQSWPYHGNENENGGYGSRRDGWAGSSPACDLAVQMLTNKSGDCKPSGYPYSCCRCCEHRTKHAFRGDFTNGIFPTVHHLNPSGHPRVWLLDAVTTGVFLKHYKLDLADYHHSMPTVYPLGRDPSLQFSASRDIATCGSHRFCIDWGHYSQIEKAEMCRRGARPTASVVPPGWVLISATLACEENHDGIVRHSYKEQMRDLHDCTVACVKRVGCMAIDWFAETHWCDFYNEACTGPALCKDLSSSYRRIAGG